MWPRVRSTWQQGSAVTRRTHSGDTLAVARDLASPGPPGSQFEWRYGWDGIGQRECLLTVVVCRVRWLTFVILGHVSLRCAQHQTPGRSSRSPHRAYGFFSHPRRVQCAKRVQPPVRGGDLGIIHCRTPEVTVNRLSISALSGTGPRARSTSVWCSFAGRISCRGRRAVGVCSLCGSVVGKGVAHFKWAW